MKTPKLKLPKVKAPSLKGPKLSAPKGPKAPRFVTDLYGDLRDRHLLLPAVLLLVALVAVPVLLSSSPEASPPPPAEPMTAGDAATQPAVVSDELVGVRDYQRRLAQFKKKNPFKQQFATPPKGTGLTSTGGGLSDGGSGGTATSTVTTAPSDTGGTTSAASSAPAKPAPADPSSDSAPPAVEHAPPRIVTRLVTRRIDVKVGPLGSIEEMEGVRPFDILPSTDAPVVAFLGASDEGDRAAFVLSSDATPVDGDGLCAPSPTNCLFITLEEGESALIDYAGDGLTYKLKLQRIRDVRVKQNH
jgi:hypothetical protein